MNRSFLASRRVSAAGGAPPEGSASFVERKSGPGGIDSDVVAAVDTATLLAEPAIPVPPVSGIAPARTATFDDVYTAYAGFVWRVLRGMGVSDVQVEDAVQDVFMVVHRRLGEFDGVGSIKTWLFQITYRTAC